MSPHSPVSQRQRLKQITAPIAGRGHLVRHALAALLLLSALSGCRNMRDTSGEPAPGPDVPRPEDVLDFKSLYAQNCQSCHGANGQNGPASNLANAEYEAWIDDATLRDIVANGEKGVLMPSFSKKAGGNLTEQQVDVLVRGMRQAWYKGNGVFGGSTPPPYHPAAPANAAAGQAVYAAACARCHGPDYHHPGPAGNILDGTFLALINEQTIRTTVVAGRPDIGQPDWRGDIPGQPLTDAQVTNLAAWMIAQRPPHPGHPYPTGTPNAQPTSERPGEQQPLSEKNDTAPSNKRDAAPGTKK